MLSEKTVIDAINSTPAVQAARDVAESAGAHVYLAGDALRDMLLGLKPTEFDFIVSTDPVEFAREMAARASGQVRNNEAGDLARYEGLLGNLTVVGSRGRSILQCVKLHYCFTVNCVAFDLEDDKFLYFDDSKSDIENAVIRAVSPSSLDTLGPFVPFRAIRLALLTPGFRLDEETANSIRSHRTVVLKATSHRLFEELAAILSSRLYRKGLDLLQDTGLLEQIYKSLLPASARQAEDHASWLCSTIGICEAMDDLMEPFDGPLSESVPDYLLMLRTVALMIPETKASFLAEDRDGRRGFLVARGEHLENVFRRGMLSSRAFRIRIITIAYLLGLAALNGGNARMAEAPEHLVKRFGAWKGGLAAILLCADRIAIEGRQVQRAEMIKVSRSMVETSVRQVICANGLNKGLRQTNR